MMYKEKLAVSIKNNGKVLRENKDQIQLPFNSEYTLLIKNLNSVRAVVHIDIDGQSVTGSGGLVIDKNSTVELERFIKDNLNQGNRFKFIERTSSIEQYRGVKVDDGLVRVEFQFEDPIIPPHVNYQNIIDEVKKKIDDDNKKVQPWKPYPWYDNNSPKIYCSGNITTTGGTASSSSCLRSTDLYGSLTTASVTNTDIGITVPGSISNQQFVNVDYFPLLPTKHVLVLKLVGIVGNTIVERPITVDIKPKCVTCGRKNKATAKFCSNCGTSLQIV